MTGARGIINYILFGVVCENIGVHDGELDFSRYDVSDGYGYDAIHKVMIVFIMVLFLEALFVVF